MAIKFNDVNGEAKKSEIDYYKFEEGENRFRMFGGVLPRYVYWKKAATGDKNMSVECLGFDREKEKFVNIEKDWFQHYFPEDKCSWSYMVKVFDTEDGKIKVLGLKKKLFGQILEMAKKHLGDPTDHDNGWEVVVSRTKTGPLAFNVEYSLDQLSCKKMPLTDKQKEQVANDKTIDELFPRPTPEEQKAFVEKVWFSKGIEEEKEEVEEDVAEEFDDDIPF